MKLKKKKKELSIVICDQKPGRDKYVYDLRFTDVVF